MSMETDVAVLRTQMNELLNLIKGNGKPGLDDRVRNIESKLNQHLADDCEEKDRREKEKADMLNDKHTQDNRKYEMDKSIKVILISVVVTQLAGLLVELIKFGILK